MRHQSKASYFRPGDWVSRKKITMYRPPGLLQLESGRTLGPVTVGYETYGKLSSAGDNAIYLAHALTGTPLAASDIGDKEKGWWEGLVGPGKAFDTNRYFVVCANVLGSCYGTTGPSSLNPKTGVPFAMDFPVVTVRDMVRVQKKLLDCLGVKRVFAVAGGSLGGMQALEWAVMYPEIVDNVIVFAASERLTPLAIAYNQVGRRAIMDDPDWCGGNYYGRTFPVRGLALARMVGTITYKSSETFEKRFGRKLAGERKDYFNFYQNFEVESYLDYQGDKLVRRFDANSYLYLLKALDLHDLSRGYPSIKAALQRIKSKVLLVGISSDLLFPTGEIRGLAVAMRRYGVCSAYREITSTLGHDAFLVEFEQIAKIMEEFLYRPACGPEGF